MASNALSSESCETRKSVKYGTAGCVSFQYSLCMSLQVCYPQSSNVEHDMLILWDPAFLKGPEKSSSAFWAFIQTPMLLWVIVDTSDQTVTSSSL